MLHRDLLHYAPASLSIFANFEWFISCWFHVEGALCLCWKTGKCRFWKIVFTCSIYQIQLNKMWGHLSNKYLPSKLWLLLRGLTGDFFMVIRYLNFVLQWSFLFHTKLYLLILFSLIRLLFCQDLGARISARVQLGAVLMVSNYRDYNYVFKILTTVVLRKMGNLLGWMLCLNISRPLSLSHNV